MDLTVPELSLVVLVGISGSGKSRFAARHFRPSEVLSSDAFRLLVSDDEADQSATDDAFELLGAVAGKRLARKRLTVVDATSVQRDARAPLIALARAHHVVPVAIVLDRPWLSARPATRPGPTARSPSARFSASTSSCAARCGASSARASATSTSSATSTPSSPPASSGPDRGPTGRTTTGPSI